MFQFKWIVLAISVAFVAPRVTEYAVKSFHFGQRAGEAILAYKCYNLTRGHIIPFVSHIEGGLHIFRCLPRFMWDHPPTFAELWSDPKSAFGVCLIWILTATLISMPIIGIPVLVINSIKWFLALYSVMLKHLVFHLSMMRAATSGVS